MNRVFVLIALLCSPFALAVPAFAQLGDGYIGIYGDPGGYDACAFVDTNTQKTLYVIAKLSGLSAEGLTGAEFRVEVPNPDGWFFSYSGPSNASLVMGNPIDLEPNELDDGSGVNIAFSACQMPSPTSGSILLGTITAINQGGDPTLLLVKKHSSPSNAGYQCPLFTLCDDPAYTKSCVTPNLELPCVDIGLGPTPLKGGNDSYFAASLNGAIPDLGIEEEWYPDREVVVHFVPGVFSMPPGTTSASYDDVTVSSNQIDTICQTNNVEKVIKAFPEFTLADTLSVARTGETVRLANFSEYYILRTELNLEAQALISALNSVEDVVVFCESNVNPYGIDDTCTYNEAGSQCTATIDCPSDEFFPIQWNLFSGNQTVNTVPPSRADCAADIDAPSAWGYETGSPSRRIAIIDTGILDTHEEFLGRVSGEFGFEPDPGVPNSHFHGTSVAGAAAASRDNLDGIAGIHGRAQLLAYLLFDENTNERTAHDIIKATRDNAHVINMSFGSSNRKLVTAASLANAAKKNIFLVAAAGNTSGSDTRWPAAERTVFGVGASNLNAEKADFSTSGVQVEVLAPGDDITSTTGPNSDSYAINTVSGTLSFSTGIPQPRA